MPKLSRPVLLFLKGVFSAIAMGGLIAGIDWRQVPDSIVGYRWEFAVAAFIGLMIQFPISGLKWHAALRLCNVDLSFTRLTRFYCISHFVGQFLPTSIGGDAYRVYRVLPLVEPRSRAVTSILIDRIVGLAALLLLGAAGALFLLDHFTLPRGYLTLLAAGGTAALLVAAAMYLGWFGFMGKRLQRLKLVAAIRADILLLVRAGWNWLPLIIMAFVFQLIAVEIVHLLFVGAGSTIGFAEVCLIAAIAGIAGIFPLAINGIGITEGTITLAGVAVGADYEDAAVAAVLLRIAVLPLSCACGVLYWREPHQLAPVRLHERSPTRRS
ncbi:MAG TPA: lysylphosphatidylglycerol synthase transmembrane domain-containing protein [Steroidobacteraceae bacterium]|nr:lysylphosphatidylglycerol synthase transmembrane domain-containing protein [Steroidobacteraceae bacterium]